MLKAFIYALPMLFAAPTDWQFYRSLPQEPPLMPIIAEYPLEKQGLCLVVGHFPLFGAALKLQRRLQPAMPYSLRVIKHGAYFRLESSSRLTWAQLAHGQSILAALGQQSFVLPATIKSN